jgi:hypothetical protein
VGGAYSSGWADGSLVQLLRKCLVTGYGSGAQASGAGWSQPYNGTSKGVFQQGGGNGRCIRVLDDGSATAGAREAKMTGYGAMSDVDTGTDQFPSSSQNSGVLYCRKSDTADSTQRSWVLYADDKTFYLFVYTGFSTAYYAGFMFGDFVSYVDGDTWNTIIIGRVTSAATDAVTNELLDQVQIGSGSAVSGHYMPRGYNQLGTSITCSKMGAFFTTTGSLQAMASQGLLPFPNPSDGKVWITRLYIVDTSTTPTGSIRGYLRGLWDIQHAGVNTPLEYSVNGSGALTGRIFKILGLRTGNSANGRYVVETSDTWD